MLTSNRNTVKKYLVRFNIMKYVNAGANPSTVGNTPLSTMFWI